MKNNNRELVLGQIPLDYNPDKHIPIGTFCFLGREEVDEEWLNLSFNYDPFISIDEIKSAEKICSDYTLWLLDKEKEYFNNKLGLNYSIRFWKIILFPWLIYCVDSLYERQSRIRKFITIYSNENIHVKLMSDNIDWDFLNVREFFNRGLQNIIYNEWLFSRILENIMPSNWTYEYVDKSIDYKKSILNNNKTYNKTNFLKSYIKKTKLYKIYNLKNGFYRVYGIHGFRFFDYLTFNLFIFLKNLSSDINDTLLEKTISDVKTSVKIIKWDLDINYYIEKNTTGFINNLSKKIYRLRNKKYNKNKINIIGADPITNDENNLKLDIALRYENGEKLIPCQHGGHNYGTSKLHNLASLVEYNHYRYITWGWNEQEDFKGSFVPLALPRKNNFYNTHKQKNNNIILVGNYMIKYFQTFTGYPRSKQSLEYRKNKITFIDDLSKIAKENLLYRPYNHKHQNTYNDENYLLQYYPKLKILYNNFENEIYNCNLLILDHPGTTLITALIANIPFICYWEKRHFPFSKQAELLLEDFSNTGIYFKDPSKAADKVNKINNSVEKWWCQDKIQQSRKHYIEKHGLISKDWRNDWKKFISSLN